MGSLYLLTYTWRLTKVKRTLNDKFQYVEYFLYYIFMIAFCLFLSYYAIEVHFTFYLFPFLSITAAFLSVIILINFYYSVVRVIRLLPIFIGLLTVLFLGSAIAEAMQFGCHFYVLVMKSSLYFFCILKPLEHLCLLVHKMRELRK